MRIYKVTKQFGDGKEQFCKDFKTVAEAKAHATDSATENATMKIKAVYRVYEFDELVDTIDSSKIESKPAQDDSLSGSAGGKQSGSTFKPTPFAMAPRPSGTPPKWVIDPDEDDKNKK